jgi:PAS domain S-box-containing protein
MDITQQKEAKESLREMDAQKSSILDAIPQAIVGLENRQINFANAAVEEVFGWRPEELIGRSVTLFYRNDREADEIGRHFSTTLEHQRTSVAEFPAGAGRLGNHLSLEVRRIGDKLRERRISLPTRHPEQRRSQEELANSREQLRNLSAHLRSVGEKESTRIAREIHDELGQSLSALQMDLSWLGGRLPAEEAPLAEKVHRMRRLVDATIDSVHRISTELRPMLLDDLGLTAAMEWQVQEFQARTGVLCEARLDCKDASVEKDLATTVFRIFQETLTNVARHAEATSVRVRLAQRRGELRLDVSDNGKGITKAQIEDPKSYGIMGIRERVIQWGGGVTITGRPRKGTAIKVRIPTRGKAGTDREKG